jgi:hypothetical protein
VGLTDIWFRGSLSVAFTVQPTATSDGFRNITAGLGSIVTALAVVIGGIWAYFKFVRGRTYRPRLAVKMLAQWRLVDERHLLHARIIVTNIGASVVTLRQPGTGLRISLLSPRQLDPPSSASWDVVGVFDILRDHQWIEAGETVSDDQLLDIGVSGPVVSLFEARLVWGWSGNKNEIVVMARQVVPPDSAMGDPTNVDLAQPARGEVAQK